MDELKQKTGNLEQSKTPALGEEWEISNPPAKHFSLFHLKHM
jgi:hypothetical protein